MSFIYTLGDKRFYEPMDSCPVDARDYRELVENKIDSDWELVRKGVWLQCALLDRKLPVQGWKIHLSAVPNDSAKILEAIAGFLISQRVTFKFLLDLKTLRLTNSKSWTRGGSGKFITVYPAGEAQFKQLLEDLHRLTKDFRGPYILSDRRYKDSKVVHYRYGGILLKSRLEANGQQTPVLVAPDGSEIQDLRAAYYSPPSWVADPFPAEDAAAGTSLNNGRYAVRKAIHFSNTGGIYVAFDNVTQKEVVLKEARAHVHGVSDDMDAACMLRREFSMLTKIASCGIAPKPLEMFQEWEHHFLAEEYLEDYVSLNIYGARDGVMFDTRPTKDAVGSFVARYLAIFQRLAGIVDTLHSAGVVFGDFSANNVLIHPTTLDVKIVDLEGAYIEGETEHTRQYTPGFADAGQLAGEKPSPASDYYAFGAIMLHMLTHVNGLLELKPQARGEILREMSRDFGLPAGLLQAIENLLGDDSARRTRPSVLLEAVAGADGAKIGEIGFMSRSPRLDLSSGELEDLVRESCRFVKANADYHRKDRLFPADSRVYETNPLSLAHGAAGVVYALNKIEGKIEPAMLLWIKKQTAGVQDYAPGLHIGTAGIAWALLELGEIREAESLFERSFGHPLLSADPGLYYGLAGWGMANLRFWTATKKDLYLSNAREAAASLLRSAKKSEAGLHWPAPDGQIQIGLAHGAAGIALFLLYLDAAVGDGSCREAAIAALDYDLAQAETTPAGGSSWPKDDDPHKILYPYWAQGSAGIGIVCLRFLKALKEPRYLAVLDRIHIDCDRKYTIFPGKNDGLAGIGEFLLDAFQATRDEKYLDSAYRVAAGLKVFALRDKDGVSFPGNGLARISCDYATGTSGVILFFDRLLNGRESDFMLDELIQ